METNNNNCDCGHHLQEHDIFGFGPSKCQKFDCECLNYTQKEQADLNDRPDKTDDPRDPDRAWDERYERQMAHLDQIFDMTFDSNVAVRFLGAKHEIRKNLCNAGC